MPNPLDEITERLALRLRVQCHETQNEKDIAYLLRAIEELRKTLAANGFDCVDMCLARAARAEGEQP